MTTPLATRVPPAGGGGAPLSSEERARGRRIAITSHPAGMTYSRVFTQDLPTLALVSLGASESQVGLQNFFSPGFQFLQLPALRAVARVSKRSILLFGHALSVVAGVPLLFFATLQSRGGDESVLIALASFAVVAAGQNLSNTVWFPMLRAYVEPERIGRFFGTLRSGWHLALILYYLGAQRWLAANPGDLAPLFAIAWGLGIVRIVMIARMPERDERTGERIHIREAVALIRENPDLRRYLFGVGWEAAVRVSVVPFVIVMMQREVGFEASQVIITTVASFAGGLASLYLWGRITDRIGTRPVFVWTSLLTAALYGSLVFVSEPGPETLALLTAFFFLNSALSAGAGVAETHVLFRLTPPEAPARTLVMASVAVGSFSSLAPLLVGLGLEQALSESTDRIGVYHAFFIAAAAVRALAFLPMRRF
jgi:Na+/melibiose symporter-like transporter